jgi:hypothetical protein
LDIKLENHKTTPWAKSKLKGDILSRVRDQNNEFLINYKNSLLTKDKRIINKSRKIKVLKGGAYEQSRVGEAHG